MKNFFGVPKELFHTKIESISKYFSNINSFFKFNFHNINILNAIQWSNFSKLIFSKSKFSKSKFLKSKFSKSKFSKSKFSKLKFSKSKISKSKFSKLKFLKSKFSKLKFLTSNFSNYYWTKSGVLYSVLAKEPLLYRFDKSCYAILNNKLNQC